MTVGLLLLEDRPDDFQRASNSTFRLRPPYGWAAATSSWQLEGVQITVSNSGPSPSWCLDRVLITHGSTAHKQAFVFQRWLGGLDSVCSDVIPPLSDKNDYSDLGHNPFDMSVKFCPESVSVYDRPDDTESSLAVKSTVPTAQPQLLHNHLLTQQHLLLVEHNQHAEQNYQTEINGEHQRRLQRPVDTESSPETALDKLSLHPIRDGIAQQTTYIPENMQGQVNSAITKVGSLGFVKITIVSAAGMRVPDSTKMSAYVTVAVEQHATVLADPSEGLFQTPAVTAQASGRAIWSVENSCSR